ncbi:MAG: hypothetical protein AAFY48_15335 [Bacteroidota bacterium]
MENLHEREPASVKSRFSRLILHADYQSLKLIAAALDYYDPQSEVDFAEAIDIVLRNRFSQAQLAAEFKVSEGTISRWRAGKSCPPSYARKVIVEQLREMLIHSATPEQREFINERAYGD